MKIGCICDDFTGASDIGAALARSGMETVLYSGVPEATTAGQVDMGDVDAGVVALKSRTIAAAEAVALSLAALRWLKAQGCQQIVFKYCSTFDSTDEGNIGPVADALLEALSAERAVVCPAFPGAGRTIFQGHLFVADRLLSESGMEHHPLTPMRDPDIRRVLARQSRHQIGHVPIDVVERGAAAIETTLDAEAAAGRRLIVVDALHETHLRTIAAAVAQDRLITGGSGVALGLPHAFGFTAMDAAAVDWAPIDGPSAALAGSTSRATRAQAARHQADGAPCYALNIAAVMAGELTAEALAEWALARAGDVPPLIYSADAPEAVAAAQARFGRAAVATTLEQLFAELALRLTAGGVTRLITAGGETSGAIVAALGLGGLRIGPEIDPGVPAVRADGLGLALKSGNFGAEDFFAKAACRLGGAAT